MIYHRREGERVRPWRIGWQWWHGLNLHFKTRRHYIRVVIGNPPGRRIRVSPA